MKEDNFISTRKEKITLIAKRKTKTCPYCKENIKLDAKICRHCDSHIISLKFTHEGTCPFCKEEIHTEALKCKHCLSNLFAVTATESIDQDTLRGLGDAVANLTKFFGVKPCNGCKKRQAYLNDLFPF